MAGPRIAYVGMTHLGLCSAAAAAGRGFEVVACDPREERIEALTRLELPVVEPDLREMLQRCCGRLRFTAKLRDLGECDVVVIAPDIPTDESGESDVTGVELLLESVRPELRPDATLVILSQVPPGFTRSRAGAGESLFYQVETLVFGRAMERALNPERLIVGARDPSLELPPAYRAFLESFGCPILVMRYESAELAKISINLCLVATITAANTLAEICEAVGGSWSEIAPSLRLDRRIGEHAYLAPGLGIAGGNLERDLATIRRVAMQMGTDARLVDAAVANSQYRRDWVLRTLHAEVLAANDAKVAVLGLAYKPNTASTKNSPSLALANALLPFDLNVYDPVAELGGEWSHPRTSRASTPMAACRGADAVALMTPWREFAGIDPRELALELRGRCVIDPHGVLDGSRCRQAGLDYFTLGTPPLRAET